MSNVLKFCSCRSCRAGRHACKYKHREARIAQRKLRHNTKAALRQGQEPNRSVSVGYTD
jgi:hypothetical protein